MKKSLFTLVFVIIGISAYFIFKNRNNSFQELEHSQKASAEKGQSQQEGDMQISDAPMDVDMNGVEATSEDSELDKKFEEQEQLWLSQVETLLVKDLDIGERKFQEYLKMREGLANDKIRAFENFHKELEAKYGPNYTYNPTEEELLFEKDINKKYDELLQSHIGTENYKVYLELRDTFNQKLIEEQDPKKGVVLMDL